MKFGINVLARENNCDLREYARRIEASGFESLFLPEHTHIPVEGDIHSGGPGTHERMKRMPDPYIALTAVAAVTSTLRIGTGISLIAQHDPVAMAKRIATIDQISNGRFMLGVGTGWNRTEAKTHGISPHRRWHRMRENVLAMKAIWNEEVASFNGEDIHFEPLWSWPKPVQPGGPPVIIGGEGPTVLDRVLDYGDAWGPHPLPGVAERINELRKRSTSLSKPAPSVTLFNVKADRETIEFWEQQGVERCVFYIYDDGDTSIDDGINTFHKFIREWNS